jgi:hypothetical protein
MNILPRIHHNVKSFIFEPISMELILHASNYPNLTELKLLNFSQGMALNHFTNKKNNQE